MSILNKLCVDIGYGSEPPHSIPLSDLPWATFFYSLGDALSNIDHNEGPIIAGVSVPTRAYAAALIATGLISTKAESYVPTIRDQTLHFDSLKSQLPGTNVTKFSPISKRNELAKIVGAEELEGTDYLILQLNSGGAKDPPTLNKLTASSCLNVSISSDQEAKLSVNLKQVSIHRDFMFAHDMHQNDDINQFYGTAVTELLIVGTQSVLAKEISSPVINIGSDPAEVEPTTSTSTKRPTGSLQELLKVRRLGGTNIVYKSNIWPSASPASFIPDQDIAPVIIFDGAVAFAKWKTFFPGSTLVLILDRTEPSHDLGQQELLSDYYQNRDAEREIPLELAHLACPSGIDTKFYYRHTR